MPLFASDSAIILFIMLLITGGTGFVGNALVSQLSELGYPIRLLIRPSQKTPQIPSGISVDVAITSLNDDRGLRAAMKGVDAIIHLASAEQLGRKAELTQVDIQGTQSLVIAARQMRVNRIVYLSHIGADRESAYPLMKAKALAEQAIKSSGIPYTIFRSSITYGKGDHFTNSLAFILKISPFLVMVPDQGSTLLQPIWIEDLVKIMAWSLQMPETKNKIVEVGGPEYISFREICEMITEKLNINRYFINIKPVIMNRFTELLEILIPNFPTTVFWLDYLATNRTTDLGFVSDRFDLLPSRMSHKLDYLEGKRYNKVFWKIIISRKRSVIKWD